MNSRTMIGTIGSHSALNILSGAQAEGIEAVLFTKQDRQEFYESFGVADRIIVVDDYIECLEEKWKDQGLILVPHGSFVAYLPLDIF